MDNYKIDLELGKSDSLANLEEELTIDTASNDISKIVNSSCEIEIDSCKLEDKNIAVSGNAVFNIYYIDNKNELEFLQASSYFNHSISTECESGEVNLNTKLEEVKAVITSSRTIKAMCNVNFDCDIVQKQIIMPVEAQNINVDTTPICSCNKATTIRYPFNINEDVRISSGLPMAKRILHTKGYVAINNVKTDMENVIIYGDIILCTTYCSDDNIPVWQNEAIINFEQMVDCDVNLQEYKICPHVQLCKVDTRLNDGEVFNYDIDLLAKLKLYHYKPCMVTSDAYSTTHEITFDKKPIKFKTVDIIDNVKHTIRKTVDISNTQMEKPICVMCDMKIDNSFCLDDSISFDGQMICDILYLNGEGVLNSAKFEMPIDEMISIMGVREGMSVEMTPNMQKPSMIQSGKEMDIRCNLNCEIICKSDNEHTMIENIQTQNLLDGQRTGIVVYMMDEGERLYDVASKYHVEMADIDDTDPKKLILLNALSK